MKRVILLQKDWSLLELIAQDVTKKIHSNDQNNVK